MEIFIFFHFFGKLEIERLTSKLSETSKHNEVVKVILFKSFSIATRISFLLPQRISLNPTLANSYEVAFQIPLVAPVINAILSII